MMMLSSYVWSEDVSCQPSEERKTKQNFINMFNTTKKMKVKEKTESYLIDLIRQLGQNGDPYDAVFNTVL